MVKRSEELARLRRALDDALVRLERAEGHVSWSLRCAPSLDPQLRRLQRNVVVASRAYERVRNDWFPPDYADCVEGYEMRMFGPNQGKIRPYRSKGPWRAFPVDPLEETPLAV